MPRTQLAQRCARSINHGARFTARLRWVLSLGAVLLGGLGGGSSADASVGGQVVVAHAPVATSTYGRAVPVKATVTCTMASACSASLMYRAPQVWQGEGGWTRADLVAGTPTTAGGQDAVPFEGAIPAASVGTRGVDYFLEARDGVLSGRWPAASHWHVQTLNPPVVRHIPPPFARPDAPATVELSSTCSTGNCSATVFYRESPGTMAESSPVEDGIVEDPQWASATMRQTASLDLGDLGDELSFSGELPASVVTTRGADYYFRVTDGETSTLWPGTMYVGHVQPTDGRRVGYHHLHVLEPTRLVHTPPPTAPFGKELAIAGKATCPLTRVCTARLYWRTTDADILHTDTQRDFQSAAMTVTRGIGLDLTGTIDVKGMIPAADVDTRGVDYFFSVSDGSTVAWYPGTTHVDGYVVSEGTQVGYQHVRVLEPPHIVIAPVLATPALRPYEVSAQVSCATPSCSVNLHYTTDQALVDPPIGPQRRFVTVPMTASAPISTSALGDLAIGTVHTYKATIPAADVTTRGLAFYISADDGYTSAFAPGLSYEGAYVPRTDGSPTGPLYPTTNEWLGIDREDNVFGVQTHEADLAFPVRVLEPPHPVTVPPGTVDRGQPYTVTATSNCSSPSCTATLSWTTAAGATETATMQLRPPLAGTALPAGIGEYAATIPAADTDVDVFGYSVSVDDGYARGDTPYTIVATNQLGLPSTTPPSLLRPAITAVDMPTAPAGWLRDGDVDITVHAQGSAAGVRSIELAVPRDGEPQLRTYPCLPGVVAVCPAQWSQTFSLAHDALPEGRYELAAVAGDGAGTRSDAALRELRVDRSSPTLELGGTLAASAPGWLEDRSYALSVAATDGSASAPRSGVRSVEILVDGEQRDFAEQHCTAGSCALERQVELDAGALAEGRHELRVSAIDQAGNTSQRTRSFGVDRRTPDLVLSGELAGESGGEPDVLRVQAREPDPAQVGSGVVRLELLVDGNRERIVEEPCEQGGCALTTAWTLANAAQEPGHRVEAIARDAAGHETRRRLIVDRAAPEIELSGGLFEQRSGWLSDQEYTLSVAATDGSTSLLGAGVRSVEVLVDGQRRDFAQQECADGNCALQRDVEVDAAVLAEGRHEVQVVAIDQAGNEAQRSFTVGIDRRAPQIALSGELSGEAGGEPGVLRAAAREPSAAPAGSGVVRLELLVDGERARLAEAPCDSGGCALNAEWTHELTSDDPGHLVEAIARDGAGHVTRKRIIVGTDRGAPTIALSGELADADGGQIGGDSQLHIDARDTVSGVVRAEILLDDERQQLFEQDCPDGGCTLQRDWTLRVDDLDDGTHTVAVVATDKAGRTAQREITFAWHPNGTPVAPALNRTQITPFADQTKFLYSGSRPVQAGVAAGTIEARRAAVIRGTVTDRTGAPVAGARVTIVGHPELGQTTSRDDGAIYMVVNGGGLLTVHIEHDDYLPVDRQLDVPWQNYAFLDDTVLVHLDPNVTAIDTGEPLPQLVAHRGSREVDANGERQATLLFPQGLEAELEMPDGSTRPLEQMHVRATEYTVGQTGPAAMPGPLPAQSAYTYAADFGVDEARAAGAKHVRFSKPVIGYLENFRGAPVGGRVPNGYYERSTQQWVPDSEGRVVKILSEAGGVAALDVTGSGQPASASDLAAIGVDDDELRKLAELYEPGQELWRVPTRHFSDWNFSFKIVGAAIAAEAGKFWQNVSDPCHDSGSIIECENQTLGEDIAITGSAIGLHYRSDRVPGRLADHNALDIRLTGPTLPAGIVGVELKIEIAGRRWTWLRQDMFAATPNRTHRFVWDGKDAFGRTLQGAQPARIHVGYVYAITWESDRVAAADRSVTFGLPPRNASVSFNGLQGTSGEPPRVTVWQRSDTTVGGFDARAAELGGWTLSPHHQYDSVTRMLYMGDGSRRAVQSVDRVINRFAGTGSSDPASTTGTAALKTSLHGPEGMDVGPDGSVYVADFYNDVVRRIKPDGTVVTVAGRQRPSFYSPRGFSGDGGPATQADLYIPRDVKVGPDGSLYIADSGNNRIRKVDPQGTITTIAGTGAPYYANTTDIGDDGPATQAKLRDPVSLAIAPDATVYIAERPSGVHSRVRRVGPDGVISTYAGGGSQTTEGIAATSFLFHSYFDSIRGIALAPDGSLYVASSRVRRVTPDGRIRTVAGNGNYSYEFGRGETRTVAPALDATIQPRWVAVTDDGTPYILDGGNDRLWRLDRDGQLRLFAGGGTPSSGNGDGGPALESKFNIPGAIAIGPDGAIYLSEWGSNTVRRLAHPMPGFDGHDIAIPSEDGAALYQFDKTGRHLRTRDTATGIVTSAFAYDSAGRLSTITDQHSNTVRVERDPAGRPAAIVAPFGQRTVLGLDSDGYLQTVRDPANRETTLDYFPGGLLSTFARPGGVISRMIYDDGGRLIRDENADGGIKTLERADSEDSYEVSVSTGLGRAKTSRVERAPSGQIVRTHTGPDGIWTKSRATDATQTAERQDGMTASTRLAPDPRFGMQSPFVAALTATRPSGAASTMNATRVVDLADPEDTFSVRSITDTATVGGRTVRRRWDRAARTWTTTDPSGRAAVSTFDTAGNVVRDEQPGSTAVSYDYDEHGRLKQTTQGERSASVHYDADGWLDSSTDALDRTTRYQRDALGRVRVTTLPDGREVRFSYNAQGDVESVTPPSRPAHEFFFTLTGLRDAWKAAGDAAATTRYRYDDDRLLIAIDRPDGTTVGIDHDSAGRVSFAHHGDWSVDYDYDLDNGALASLTTDGGQRTAWTYDGDLPTSETQSGDVAGGTHVDYDGEGRVMSSTVTGTPAVTYAYDTDGVPSRIGELTLSRDQATGQLTAATIGGSTTGLGYNGYGELKSLQTRHDTTLLFSQTNERDRGGRVTTRTEQIAGQQHTYSYGYDAGGRLANVKRDGVVIAAYDYDANGNRTLEQHPGEPDITADYDDHDRLERYGTTTYRYTSNGELRERTTAGGDSTLYTYDAVGSLTEVELPDERTISYSTDGLGRRIATKVDGQLRGGFIYGEGPSPSAQTDASGQITTRFVYATRSNVPDYMLRDGRTYRLVTDQLGSVRLVIDSQTGEIAQRIDYDPYGRVLADTDPGFQPFGYAGGLYDPDTGLVRFGARDYDPQTGRWTAKDPIDFSGGDTNLYGYVLGDPINNIDPSGNIPVLIAAVLVYKAANAADTLTSLSRILHGCGNLADAAGMIGGRPARNVTSLAFAARAEGRVGHRAVSDAELEDIRRTGQFRPHPEGHSMEDKWFSETREGAEQVRDNYPDLKHIVEADVPSSIYDNAYKHPNIDGTGPGFAVPVADQPLLRPRGDRP